MEKIQLSRAEIDRLLSRPTITADELAKVLRTSRNGAYDAIRRGEIATIKVGRKIKVLTGPLRAQLGIAS
jgi:excisionase family DNA binding protein